MRHKKLCKLNIFDPALLVEKVFNLEVKTTL